MNDDISNLQRLREEVCRIFDNVEIKFSFLRNLLEQSFSPGHVGNITLLQLVQLIQLPLSLFLCFQFLLSFLCVVLLNVILLGDVPHMISHEVLGKIFQNRVFMEGDKLFPTNTEKKLFLISLNSIFSSTDLFIVSTLQA